jgi:hypothetical protein
MKSRQLLCTFSKDTSFKDDIKKISELYSGTLIKFFVFENVKIKKEIYVTYNVTSVATLEKFPATISIHRKKETNTLYTLNAMNKIIMEENGGIFDKSFSLDWKLYQNTLILTNDIGVKIVDIKLVDIL